MVKLANTETAAQKKATRAAYGATLAELAAEGVPVVAVDADLTGSTTTKKLADAGYAGRASRWPATSRSRAPSPCSAPGAPTTRSATPCATRT